MTICMVDIEVEEFWEIGWSRERKILTEHKENFVERKAFHSENVIIHLIKANSAQAKKELKRQQNIKILTISSYHRKRKTLMGERCGDM